jgi:hypothetical protein
MDIQRLLRNRTDRLNDRGTDRYVRDEVAIHNVDMDPIGPGSFDRADLIPQLGEIGGKYRRGNH